MSKVLIKYQIIVISGFYKFTWRLVKNTWEYFSELQ